MARSLFRLLMVVGALAGCGGGTNPFMETATNPDTGTTETLEPGDPNVKPSSNFLYDTTRGLTMNSVVYDETANKLVINNIPFDGPTGEYRFDRNIGDVGVYKSLQTATTGIIQYYAVFVKKTDVEAMAVLGEWGDFGYGGANVNRKDFAIPSDLPNDGEYVYVGTYGGVRKKDRGGRVELVSGQATLALDVKDTDPTGTEQGKIIGTITNRQRQLGSGAQTLIDLPDLFLKSVSFNTANGTFEDGEAETYSPDAQVRDTGTYGGMIAGATGDEIGAHVIIEGAAEMQVVSYQIVEWRKEEVIGVDPITGGDLIQVTTGSVSALAEAGNDNVQAIVETGAPVGVLTVPASSLPSGATITNTTTEQQLFTSQFQAREVGAIATTQLP